MTLESLPLNSDVWLIFKNGSLKINVKQNAYFTGPQVS